MPETTVFQSGNSQAVRLPKEFRFSSKTVEIFRRGNEVVLREKPRTLGELLDSLPPLTEADAASLDAMLAAIKEPLPPDTRDWSWLEEAPVAKAKPGSKRAKTTR
jgi:antitoxin VapB